VLIKEKILIIDVNMVTKEEFELIEKRLEAWNEKIGIACIELGPFTKDEMLEHVKAKDETGRRLVEVQLNYIRKLKERR